MKDTQSEMKQNIQGTNSDRKETRTQSNDLEEKKEINIHPEEKEETRIQKSEERLWTLWDNLKCSNIWIIGVPEGEEQQQEIENLFEQVMKETFPNLAKEIDFEEVQEAQRVPKKWDPRRNTPRHIMKGKEESYLQRNSHKTISWFLKRNLAGKKRLKRSIWSHERQGPTCKIALSSKAFI